MNSNWIIPTLACAVFPVLIPLALLLVIAVSMSAAHENNAWRRNMSHGSLDSPLYGILAVATTVCLAPIWIPLALYIALTYSWEDTVPATEDL